jgi:hypothetical protein
LLNYEVEDWKQGAGEVSYVWVRVPELVDGGETYIWAYWNSDEDLGAHTNTPFTARRGAAWDSNFRGVWHLNETGTSARRLNSALNAYVATNYAATPVNFDGTEDVAGPSGGAVALDGVDAYLDVGDIAYYDLGTGAGMEWTVSAWFVHKGSGTGWQPLANKTDLGSTVTDYVLSLSDASPTYCYWGTGIATDTVAWMKVSPEPARNGPWHYLAGTLKATGETDGTKVGYLDGDAKTNGTYSAKGAAATGYSLLFGKHSATALYYEGSLDEIRISDVERSADWIWAEWKTSGDNANFTTYGSADFLGAPTGTTFRIR